MRPADKIKTIDILSTTKGGKISVNEDRTKASKTMRVL